MKKLKILKADIKRKIKRYRSSVIYSDQVKEIYSSGSVCNGKVKGKNVLVLGGTGGIGLACAKRYLQENVNYCVITGRKQETIDDILQQEKNKRLIGYCWDIKKDTDVLRNINKIEETVGSIEIIVICTGILSTNDRQRKIADITEEQFDESMETNYIAVERICKSVINAWKKKHQIGNIVIISSICESQPKFMFTPYGLSKRCLTTMIENDMACYQKDGIIVNGVEPGSVATRMIGVLEGDGLDKSNNLIGRILMPEEISALVVFMSSCYGKVLAGKVIEASALEQL